MSKKILVISPVPSHPQNAGNRARIYNLLLNLKEVGHNVYFAHIAETLGDNSSMQQCWGDNFFTIPYTKPETAYRKRSEGWVAKAAARAISLLGPDPRYTFAIDDWYDDRVNASIGKLANAINPDVVIAEYVFFSKVLNNFDSSVLKIIDTHDVFSNRYKLYLKNSQKPRWFSTTQRQEKKGLRRADIALAIQEKEASFFANLLQPPQQVVTVGHLVSLQPIPLQENNHAILYIGSRNHINVIGVQRFVQDIFPKIKEKIADARLILAGEICDAIEAFEGCSKLGRVDSLPEAYALANVAINPVYFGTGLKIKSTEALGYARPLVTTSVGAEGLEAGAGKAFVVAETPDDFAQSIADILLDKQRRETLSSQAYSFAKQQNLQCLSSLENALRQRS